MSNNKRFAVVVLSDRLTRLLAIIILNHRHRHGIAVVVLEIAQVTIILWLLSSVADFCLDATADAVVPPMMKLTTVLLMVLRIIKVKSRINSI